MAVDVNTVYRTVLLIINKEQRGYLTPDEFNRVAAQVQLEIFNKYFEDLNQYLRIPDNDSEYSNRINNIEEKIAIFKEQATCIYSVDSFALPVPVAPKEFYKIGTVIYKEEKEITLVQQNDLLEINLSPIAKPSVYFPIYTFRNSKIYVYPKSIVSDVSCTYLRKPLNPIWNFTTAPPTYAYTYSSAGSVNFELHQEEQTNIIIKILLYSGIVIKDPLVVQAAAQEIQTDNINSKS